MTWEWVLKVKLSFLPEDRRMVLESYLPSSQLEILEKLPSVSTEKRENFPVLPFIHWSWFLKALSSWTVEEQKLFLAILPQQTRRRLNQEIGLPPLPATPLRPGLQRFLKETLLQHMAPDVLPPSFLPSSPLNRLLDCSKKELVQLIDLTALFDLKLEMKQIVETKILQKIYSFLSEEEKDFLKIISTSPSSLPIHLETWDGTKESFRRLLHKRGLARVGSALSGEAADLRWYLSHLLDFGRGGLLLKAAEMQIGESLKMEILSQLLEAYTWKKQKEES